VAGLGLDSASADMIDHAARDLLASCWLLKRPLRPKPPPEQWHDGQQAAQQAPCQPYPQASKPPRQM
jgi:hypothetical protein